MGIIAATCIPGLGKSFRPTLVIVRRQVKTFRVPFVLYKEFGVMLVRIAHAVVAAKLLVGLVIGVNTVFATLRNPSRSGFDTKMVVLVQRQTALPVAALQYALCQGHGSRDAVFAHLFHRKNGVFFRIFFILAHCFVCLSVHSF